ncbi:MAG: HAMP domain-containing protein [Anaerolineaceae bacterium]|nr:HAMP domain-containing protein [Anaerolineaceae bacterium]
MPRRSILWGVVLPFAILLILAVVVLNIVLVNNFRQSSIDTWTINLRAQARLIQSDIPPLVLAGPPYEDLQLEVNKISKASNARVTIILPDGTVAAETAFRSSLLENHGNRPEFLDAMQGKEATDIRYSETLKQETLYAAVPVWSDGKVIGVTRLAITLEAVDNYTVSLRNTINGLTLLTILLGIGITILFTRQTIKPLVKLADGVDELTRGKYIELPYSHRKDEIGLLSRAFNRMSQQNNTQINTLKIEQAKAAAILDNMSDGVVIVTPDGLVEYVNASARRIFQIGNTIPHPSLVEVIRHFQLVDLWQKTHETRQQMTTTLENLPDKLFLQAVATPLDPDLPGHTLMVFQDLTRLRRLELVRRDFVSNVSHELRTPLASLKAISETLQEGALEDPPAARKFLSRMDGEIDNLTQMVTELLELSRIESGKLPLQKKSVDPQTLIQSAGDRMQLQAERSGLKIEIEKIANASPIMADADRIEQVLVNLIHNAIKFTTPGGKITVGGYGQKTEVVIFVRDTGVGINPDELSRIFERFYKSDRARSGKGTGLGLSISKHLVETHGGRIWAESQPGEGSTFSFSLPLA